MNLDSVANGHAKARAAESALAHEFHAVLSDIEDLVKATTSLSGEDLTRARNKLGARLKSAKESVEKAGNETMHRARDAAKATDGYVHTYPWQAIGVASVIGLLAGYALSRRG
jgi:ElaB/YqjD/DUF883 family membrane-anchored ribosome-binding protein